MELPEPGISTSVAVKCSSFLQKQTTEQETEDEIISISQQAPSSQNTAQLESRPSTSQPNPTSNATNAFDDREKYHETLKKIEKQESKVVKLLKEASEVEVDKRNGAHILAMSLRKKASFLAKP